jgi:ribonuclease HI
MSNPVVVYTDGSCFPNPGKGGWAYIALLNDIEMQDSGCIDNTTNNVMEMTAVIQALQALKEYPHIAIFSDSLYVINCARGVWKRKANTSLWGLYDVLAIGKTIEFFWVKAHNSDVYNERVDKLSRQARN